MWFKKRCVLSCVVVFAAAIMGVFRYKICFLPGLQGIFVGLLLGAIIGKLGSTSEEYWPVPINAAMPSAKPLPPTK